VFYVDGHVRAYQGGAKIAKTHLSRLKFPAPATVETWVSDAAGDPVLVVMAQPGASLAMELRRLLPDLRRAVGDQRRVLVGFDRGGWSPALFAHMDAQGFDVLTWRKGFADDVDADLFTNLTYTDETGRVHQWRVADTTVDLPVAGDQVFTMRQVSLTVPGTKTGRGEHGQDSTRQIHILTTRGDLPAEQVIYRMGSRWRQENYFRYARMHFDLDSHDAYATTDSPLHLQRFQLPMCTSSQSRARMASRARGLCRTAGSPPRPSAWTCEVLKTTWPTQASGRIREYDEVRVFRIAIRYWDRAVGRARSRLSCQAWRRCGKAARAVATSAASPPSANPQRGPACWAT